MPKKLKTFSFSDTAERNLSLLMSDLEIHSASECIRYLIDAECVRRGLIKKDAMSENFGAGKGDRSNANAVKDKDDLLREIQMVSIQMAKYNNRIEDIYKMCMRSVTELILNAISWTLLSRLRILWLRAQR